MQVKLKWPLKIKDVLIPAGTGVEIADLDTRLKEAFPRLRHAPQGQLVCVKVLDQEPILVGKNQLAFM